MATATAGRAKVARKKAAGDRPKRDDVAIKFDRALAEKAKIVAIRRGVSMAEYLTELNRAAIERDFARALKDMGTGS